MKSSSSVMSSTAFLDLHMDLKCPFLEQLWQVASLAGHCCLGWLGAFPHGVQEFLFVEDLAELLRLCCGVPWPWSRDSRLLAAFCRVSDCFALWTASIAPFVGVFMPRSVACCFLTVSLYLTALTAFCRSSCGSSCNSYFSDKHVSLIPTTIRSRISSSWSYPNAQCSASPYNEVMNELADSPSSCLRELNFAFSKIMFRRLTKCLWKRSTTTS